MNPTPPSPSRALRIFAAAVKWSLWLLFAASLLLALAWGALHGWIVPRIGEWRPALESRATQVLGVPVRIGAITARSEGLVPSFELQQVVLLDPQGREALRLPLVVGALSPRSLWKLGFEQLYIQGPELEVRRTADGNILVAGLDFSRSQDDGGAADWFFRQSEVVIQGGTLRWTDEQRAAPPLALRDVSLVVRNHARRHALRVDATPPPEWGGRFTVTGLFRQPLLTTHPGRWREWTGEVHADLAAVDLSQLRRHADIGFDVSRGHGRVRAWADVAKGQVVGGVADVQLAGVAATLAPGLEPLELHSVSGRLGGARLAGGFRFETQQLQFVTEEGHRWPGGNVAVTWNGAEGPAPARGELRADRLDLGALSLVATRLPLGTATHAALQAYAPQGLIERLQARWQGPLGALEKYEARGRASALQVAARPAGPGQDASPGVRGAAVDFELTHEGGKAKLALADGALEFPGVFDEPVLPMDSLSADVHWQRTGGQLQATVDAIKFANADAEGGGRFSWRSSEGGGPGTLDLDATIVRADGARVWRYLPLGVDREAREYVRDAVVAGRAGDARFRVRGDLRHFPFADGKEGEFLVSTKVRDVTLAYVPRIQPGEQGRWPALTHLAGELVFRGNAMEVKDATGRFANAPRLQVKVNAQIPSFTHTEVHVKGEVSGPLAESLAVVNASPLAATLDQALARSTGTGNASVDLALMLPVSDLTRSQVRGTVTLAGNDVQITPDSPLLARARGSVQFTEQGFQLVGVQARALGGDVRLEGGTRPAAGNEPAWVQLRANGTVTAEGLRQARELGAAARLAQDFSGSTNYQLTVGFRRQHPELLVTSNLQGLALDLPAPLNKPADAVLPLRYESALTREALAPGAPLHETLSVALGRIAGVTYLRDVSQPEAKVLRGAIAIGTGAGEPPPLPAEGVQANVQLDAFNIDAWEETLARVAGDAAAAAPPARDADADGDAPGAGPAALQYLPTAMSLRARQLGVEGRTLHDLALAGSRQGRIWRARVEARELSGEVEYRQPQNSGAGRLRARLARLTIGAAAATEVEALLEQQPGSIPALDVIVDDFELKGRKLGKLEIDAVNRGAGAVAREGGIREWRLNRLSLASPDMNFSASGNWAALDAHAAPGANERRRTAIRFRLDIQDAGLVLARFGMKDVVRRGRGTMEGTVAWAGSPLALDHPTLTGNFNVNVESGQFLKADPGIAKLLGVLSLQSLPRRLTLDFRDVFSEGFQFDFVRGDVLIEQGIASTNNLQMKGVNAAVLMEGKADIARETQDLKVVVVPEINAGTASLVATVINPAIGLGTFLAQYFLRDPLMRAATQEFQIDGTWADPRVRRVPRSPGSPPQAAGPSSSANAPLTGATP